MKTIYLLRHAKSSWDDANLADFDRPLNKRGLKTVPLVAEKIIESGFQIDLIVVSPATRASQTATLLKEAARLRAEIRFDKRIYEASPQRLLEVIADAPDDKNSVMLVGHNPGLEGLIKVLTGEVWAMKTAALAVIESNVKNWREIAAGGGKLRAVISPTLEPDTSNEETWAEWFVKNTYINGD